MPKSKPVPYVSELNESQNVKFRFVVSDNMRKVNRMLKNILDVQQIANEMSDELISLEQEYGDQMSSNNLSVVRNMKSNLRNAMEMLSKDNEDSLSNTMYKINHNLEQMKQVYLKKDKN